MNKNTKYAVFGSGSWATAIVKILSENLDKIGWYMRSVYTKEHILKEQHNPNYLSSVEFHTEQLILSNDINKIADWADVLIFVIPSAFIHAELQKLTVDITNKVVVSAVKGIIPETGLLVGEHFHDYYNIPFEHIGVIAGPCHAEEVALERLSYLTISCANPVKAQAIANVMKSDYIKTKISDDIIGTEYAVMLKNIYAIAAGIAHGLGYGDNFQSVLMSNAIREMKRFIKKMHKMKRNINNSAYLGDLLVTGYSIFSRNRMFGNMIGKGYTVKSAQMEMNMVAEGYYATKSAYLLNEKNSKKTQMPIINAVYGILYENKDPKKVFKKLTDKLD
ncbi:MAG: glycerol-3-phosphate dehydrogenase [Winogradskyella sp.]|uniref:NAD(P)H-dependent glycerol-3-phosphate dehydrogenase n=1 Tax=Winogradskyella sp. TaxID=1883156 RepID=UPI00185D5149|nr:NAD(P)H-dependent glycerol-3-phosphate dehydrogenase [Winogradskyella sp.]MBT8246096.1 glycerol-3-phosphate dehydrogenase [Winogradskyella sp.]NNK23000.1 glycerol-3-phosphate dehydrogenase [Winogradskyella sp.]